MDEFTAEGMTVIEHVSEAWRLLLLLPGQEHNRVSDYLGRHYAWCEVEADETAMWRAALSSERRTVATVSPAPHATTLAFSWASVVVGLSRLGPTPGDTLRDFRP
jgi:hypothetical protein